MVVKWLRTILSTSKKIVGQDYLGNTYFETAKSKFKNKNKQTNKKKTHDAQKREY